MKSQNKNFLLNVGYQILTYIFPLITVPYISRVLGVDNTGVYAYTNSIVNMFMLITMLGINNFGNRSIAKCRDDSKQLEKTFSSIYSLQLIMCVLLNAIYCIYMFGYAKQYKAILIIQGIQLLSVAFDVNWFFWGLEKFKLTVIRNLIVKIISIICIFIFVKNSSDLKVYTLIMVCATLFSQLYLFFNIPRYVKFCIPEVQDILSNIKPCLILFIPVLAYGIYRVMDKTMIGSLASVAELGNYENAERIINIPIAVTTALGTVMLPRMSYLTGNASEKEVFSQIAESMKLALMLAVAMSVGMFVYASEISLVMFGSEFEKSPGIIKALSITVIISAWANVIRTQYLIPKEKDRIYVFSTIIGAVLNFVCNICLIRRMGAYGACIGTVLAEGYVALYQTIMIKNELPIKEYLGYLLKCLINTSFIIAVSYVCTFMIQKVLIKLIFAIVIAGIMFLLVYGEYLIKEFLGKSKNYS